MSTQEIQPTQECPQCHKRPPYCQCEAKASIVPVEGGNMELSASTPREMVECHNAMIFWVTNKIALVQNEAKELQDAYEHARARKWKSDTLKRHAALALKRVEFYQKFKAALEAGFCVVPNFPVTLFAIRTDSKKPATHFSVLRSIRQGNFEQESKRLPAGEGEYRNPQPICRGSKDPVEEKPNGDKFYQFWADRWDDLEFPANMARLHVMDAANKAMALKIFDEIGFLPTDFKRNPDPILLGRLIDPRSPGYGERRRISFMIAWHIDTRTL